MAAALARHGVELPADQVAQLEAYCRELWQWNERMNLTRHDDYEKFVARDLIDTLQLAEQIKPDARVLDLGTGGGVPGVPLAIVRPDLQVSLSDSVAKKARAVEEIVGELGLQTPVYAQRAEQVLEQHKFDYVVARAVGSLVKILRWLAPYWEQVGELLIIKGPSWPEERGEARHLGLLANIEIRKAAEYATPGHDGASVILRLWPKTAE